MNFNEIFRQNVTCDNIKSYKKAELHPLPEPRRTEPTLTCDCYIIDMSCQYKKTFDLSIM